MREPTLLVDETAFGGEVLKWSNRTGDKESRLTEEALKEAAMSCAPKEAESQESTTNGEVPCQCSGQSCAQPGEVRAQGEPTLEEQLRAAQADAKQNYDRLLRTTAEFENQKKRMQREMDNFKKYANESIAKEVLQVVDNLERALTTKHDMSDRAFESLRQGVEMTLKGLLDSLKRFGVTPIEAKDKPFDPNFHHAIAQAESTEHPDNVVLEEPQKGYMLNERLLRPAAVVISKRPVTSDLNSTLGTTGDVSSPDELFGQS